jgi:hypothetical protein
VVVSMSCQRLIDQRSSVLAGRQALPRRFVRGVTSGLELGRMRFHVGRVTEATTPAIPTALVLWVSTLTAPIRVQCTLITARRFSEPPL